MLPIFPVLLLATSALAAPSVKLNIANYNEIAPPKNNGRFSSFVTNSAFAIVDDGEINPYVLTLKQILDDLANLPGRQNQALVLSQTLAILSQASGVPGDACIAANVIDAYERSLRTGNSAGVRKAVDNFVENLAASVDLIVQLANNPNSVKYAVGPRGNCVDGGRTYAFEAAWDSVLANTTPAQAALVNDQYCMAKRLYGGLFVRSNNVAAYLTAASLPPVVQAFEGAVEPLARFLGSIASGNPNTHAGAAKQALVRAL